mmetsp:Transcript_21473/g.54843  ORF Transcript_21473/g.54843 Transcript_21473/m.54843 type:complete len:254 (-) Transcript_21473:112-873(-)
MGTATACCSKAEKATATSLSGIDAPIAPGYVAKKASEAGGGEDGQVSKAFPDGSKYDGQLVSGKKQGKANGSGTYTSKHSTYEGEWQNDLKHGSAAEKWEDESTFNGSYFNGQKHGRGTFRWPEGSVYEGEFRNNNVEGEGVFTWHDGRKYRGQWIDNRMHGEGVYEWPDEDNGGNWSKQYEGQYVNDLKEGQGTFKWRDGRKFAGQWKDGKQHGTGFFRTAEGEERPGVWRAGVRVSFPDRDKEVGVITGER